MKTYFAQLKFLLVFTMVLLVGCTGEQGPAGLLLALQARQVLEDRLVRRARLVPPAHQVR
jgi:hypothetical protein